MSLQEFGFNAFIRKSWNDPRLAFTDGPEYIHFGYEVAESFIWMPDLYFHGNPEAQITESYRKDAGVRIKPNGDIGVGVQYVFNFTFKVFLNPFAKGLPKFGQ